MTVQVDVQHHEDVDPCITVETAPKDPTLEFSGKKTIINLIEPDELEYCNFWVGLFKKGKVDPASLYNLNNVSLIFEKASITGINEQESLMLTDTSGEDPSFTYLVRNQKNKFSLEEIIEDIGDTIRAWEPRKVGLYFEPKLIEKKGEQLLLDLLLELVRNTKTREYYLLPGNYGFNSILNTAVRLCEIMKEEGREVDLFH